MTAPTAAILVVGDEILAGHTLDTNSHWVAARLRDLGVRLERVEVVADRPAEIVEAVQRLAARTPTFLFVMGGLGPTPDDRTYESIAQALGVPLVADPKHVADLKARAVARGFGSSAWADPERSEGMLRMVKIPQGATALRNPVGAALGCVAQLGGTKVVVLPGVPRELKAMFDESFVPAFLPGAQRSDVTQELEVWGAEAELWEVLSRLEREHPRVAIGSYPQDQRGRLVLRVRGLPTDVAPVVEALRAAAARLESSRRPRA